MLPSSKAAIALSRRPAAGRQAGLRLGDQGVLLGLQRLGLLLQPDGLPDLLRLVRQSAKEVATVGAMSVKRGSVSGVAKPFCTSTRSGAQAAMRSKFVSPPDRS
jgi:hypothetical protein